MKKQHQLLEGDPDVVLWDLVNREGVIGFDDEIAILLLIEPSSLFGLESIYLDLLRACMQYIFYKRLIVLACIVIRNALNRRCHLNRIEITQFNFTLY